MAAAAQSRPNLVLILAGELGPADLSCYSSNNLRMPAIDSLAAAGFLFRQAYANAPERTPSRRANGDRPLSAMGRMPGIVNDKAHRSEPAALPAATGVTGAKFDGMDLRAERRGERPIGKRIVFWCYERQIYERSALGDSDLSADRRRRTT